MPSAVPAPWQYQVLRYNLGALRLNLGIYFSSGEHFQNLVYPCHLNELRLRLGPLLEQRALDVLAKLRAAGQDGDFDLEWMELPEDLPLGVTPVVIGDGVYHDQAARLALRYFPEAQQLEGLDA